jgi:hypothetical protein
MGEGLGVPFLVYIFFCRFVPNLLDLVSTASLVFCGSLSLFLCSNSSII